MLYFSTRVNGGLVENLFPGKFIAGKPLFHALSRMDQWGFTAHFRRFIDKKPLSVKFRLPGLDTVFTFAVTFDGVLSSNVETNTHEEET